MWRYRVTAFYVAGPFANQTRTFLTNHPYVLGEVYAEGDRTSQFKVVGIHDQRYNEYERAA